MTPAPPRAHPERDLLAWSLLATLILLAGLAGPFFAGRVYTLDDLGAFHLPVRAFYADQLARGEPFDWMPQLYSGFYLTGEGQAGTYHPLHLLLYRYLPLNAATAWEWLISYPLMAAGTWLFLRRRLRRPAAAMFGSLLVTFSGFNLLHFIHPNAIAVVAHIPWLLWASDIVLLESRRRQVTLAQAAVALLTGSQLLLGYPQYVWFSLLAEFGFAVFALTGRKYAPLIGCDKRVTCGECVGCTSSPWMRLAIAKGCGLLLGGVQLVPTIDALCHSTRQSVDAAFAQFGSLHPLNLVQLVAPYLFTDRVLGGNTHEFGVYIGAAPLMLVVWMIARRKQLRRLGPLAAAVGVFGLLALLLAFGQYGGLYRLQTYLPLVGHFRCPCRYLVLFHMAMAVLATIGFVLLAQEGTRNAWRDERRGTGEGRRAEGEGRRARGEGRNGILSAVFNSQFLARAARLRRDFDALWAIIVLSVAVAIAGLGLQGRPWIASAPAVLAGPLLVIAAALLVVAAARGVRGALVALILFAAADLGSYGLTYAFYCRTDTLDHFVTATPTPPASPSGRVLAELAGPGQTPPLRTGNELTLAGWRRADGYAGLEPGRQLDYRQLAAIQVAGVRWVKRDATTTAIPGLIPHGPHWLEVPGSLPRARLVAQAVVSRSPARDIQQIDVKSAALTEYQLALPAATPGSVTVLADRPGRLEMLVDCPASQLLVVSESYHAGWQATVDGRRQPVLRVNGDFLGCCVGPNAHRVVLEFRPLSLQFGWVVSCIGLAMAAICFVGSQVRPELR